MTESIYKSDSFGAFTIIVEGDEHALWSYLFEQVDKEYQLLCSSFVCSRGRIAGTNEEVTFWIEKDFQPPLMKEYASEKAVQKSLVAADINIILGTEDLVIEVREEPFLKVTFDDLSSYSKAVSKVGPYGNPWK